MAIVKNGGRRSVCICGETYAHQEEVAKEMKIKA